MWRPCHVPSDNHHHCHRHHHHDHHHCHHHHSQLFLCPHNILHRRHVCPNFAPRPANPNDVVFVTDETPELVQYPDSLQSSKLKEKENEEIEEVEEEEFQDDDDDDEPIFVLTDEWRDFFAKSEAKRKLEKKLAKKGKKK